LHKELSGYANYGNADGKADVLYSGETATWTFISTGLSTGTPVQFRFQGVLDDHDGVALEAYSLKVIVNDEPIFAGFPTGFRHGLPGSAIFTNWATLVVDAKGQWSVTIQNTSRLSPAEWIGVDWIELAVSWPYPVFEHLDCTSGWTRLTVGNRARVSEESATPNRVRSEPNTGAAIISQLNPGTTVDVLEGPLCTEGLVYWKVQSEAIPSGAGWTAEGDGTEYYLVPDMP
jgi:hypothetical protein